jgi:hypothetical protein
MVSTMPRAVNGLTKHEALGRRRSRRQHQAIGGAHGAVLRVHRPADHRNRLAHQRLGRIGRAGLDDHAGALIADRHRLVEPSRHALHRRLRHFRGNHRRVFRTGGFGGRHIGRTDQKPEVRRIDRRGLDPDHDFIGGRFTHGDTYQRYLQLAALLDQRTKFKSGRVV